MEILWQDFRHAIRLFFQTRAFALTAIIALALGIGANTFGTIPLVLLATASLPFGGQPAVPRKWTLPRRSGTAKLKARFDPKQHILSKRQLADLV